MIAMDNLPIGLPITSADELIPKPIHACARSAFVSVKLAQVIGRGSAWPFELTALQFLDPPTFARPGLRCVLDLFHDRAIDHPRLHRRKSIDHHPDENFLHG